MLNTNKGNNFAVKTASEIFENPNTNLDNLVENNSLDYDFNEFADRLVKCEDHYLLLSDRILNINWVKNIIGLVKEYKIEENDSGLKRILLTIDSNVAREFVSEDMNHLNTSDVPKTGVVVGYQNNPLRDIIDNLLTGGEVNIIYPIISPILSNSDNNPNTDTNSNDANSVSSLSYNNNPVESDSISSIEESLIKVHNHQLNLIGPL